jgi:translation elongation factor EF-Ts
MHIAARGPAAVTAEELDPALIERERAVYTEQAKASASRPRSRPRWSKDGCARSSSSRWC